MSAFSIGVASSVCAAVIVAVAARLPRRIADWIGRRHQARRARRERTRQEAEVALAEAAAAAEAAAKQPLVDEVLRIATTRRIPLLTSNVAHADYLGNVMLLDTVGDERYPDPGPPGWLAEPVERWSEQSLRHWLWLHGDKVNGALPSFMTQRRGERSRATQR